MIALFDEILFRPLLNLLIFIYNISGNDFGVSILLLTILVRLLLMPLSIKAAVSQKNIAKIQPKIRELQKRYKDNKQVLAQETMAIYKEYGVNPLSGCLPILIQLPILWALYQVFSSGFKPETLNFLYGFIENPGKINELAFGFVNISSKNPIVALITGGMQFIQSKISLPDVSVVDKNDPTQQMSRQMLYFLPILITIIAWNLPIGIGLYWIVTTVFSIFEQLYIKKKYK